MLDSDDQFTFFVDELNDGSLDVQLPFNYDPVTDIYNFNPVSISTAFGIGALEDDDNFYIKSIHVSAVPVPAPAALPLFGFGLIGLVFFGRLKNKFLTTKLRNY